MATIKINFDKESIREAIKEIQAIKKKFKDEIPNLYLSKCLEWVRDWANTYLLNLKLSHRIVGDIITEWSIERVNKKTMRLVNRSDKAVFIEFGVGHFGSLIPHPNATNNNPEYRYNLKTGKKDKAGIWRFRVNDENDIDLIEGNYWKEDDLVMTDGSPANLYLYNAAMDLVSTGAYKTIWQETLKLTV